MDDSRSVNMEIPYKPLKLLGVGANGEAWFALRIDTNETMVVKTLRLPRGGQELDKLLERLKPRMCVIVKLEHHQNVIRHYGYRDIPGSMIGTPKFEIFMEYAEGAQQRTTCLSRYK